MPNTTTGYAPAPAPPRRRSFAGAVVLIAIGVVFLLGNMHVITWQSLWRSFAHYWPVLLILYGVVKLIEYFQTRSENRQFSGVGAGGVVLVIFIIICGLTISGIERMRGQINWNEINGDVDFDNNGFGAFLGNLYTYDQEIQQDFPAGASLKVVSDRGSVTVTAWDQNKVRVQVNKKVRADSQDEANKVNQATQAQITVAGQEVTVSANLRSASKPVESDLQIFVPKKAAVIVDTRRGDVVITDRTGNVKVSNSSGDVNLANITGNADVTIRPGKGSFKAANVTGDVTLDGRIEDTSIADVGGNVRMTGDYFGDMNIAKVAKEVTFKTSRTDLQFAKLEGNMSIESGDLHATSVVGPMRLATRSKDIQLDNVSGDMNIENSNGSVTVDVAKAPLGQISIDNSKGDVSLTLPPKANFEYQVKTRRGQISSDFGSVNSSGGEGESVANGSVGNGGPKVVINSEYGDVSIRKAT